MPQVHIRLTRTSDIENVLNFLRSRYRLLSEAEIIKLALSEKYKKELDETIDKRQPNIIDLETQPNLQEAKTEVRIPRRRLNLLSMAGAFKGPADLSRHKKKYTY